ncbi:hypothetical protein TNCV_1303501 [Trichonephila clavipes]|nr:hypothetical protein TNCV_1303501 [Trichonephila clavipes]
MIGEQIQMHWVFHTRVQPHKIVERRVIQRSQLESRKWRFQMPHRKKLRHVKSGYRGGHWTGPPQPILRIPKVASR